MAHGGEARPVRNPRQRLQAADVVLRRAPRFQLVRRACLACSFAFIVVVPFLHASANAVGAGRAASGAARVPLVGAPWSVSLFGFELMDPLAALTVGVTEVALVTREALDGSDTSTGGTSFGSTPSSTPSSTLRARLGATLIGLLPLSALIVLLGRYFCSWLCPYAAVVAVSNAARSLLAKLGVPLLDVRLPRATAFVTLAALLLASAGAGVALVPLVYPPAVIARSLFSLAAFGTAGAGAVVVVALVAFDTLVSRAGFCRSLCPGGAVFRALSFASPVRVVREAAKCTSCTVCDTVCNMGQSPMTDVVDAGCDRCARCVSSCPTGALDIVLIGRRGRPR